MKKVMVAVADGVEEIEAVTIIDVLRRAGADVTVTSVGNRQIVASRQVRITADKNINECLDEEYDLIVLPGGIPGANNLAASEPLSQLLKRQRDANKLYGAICASPAVVLESQGLLEGKKATCYPSFAEKLTDSSSADQQVVVDGNCVTSQGPGTAMKYALKLVELLYDAQKAQELADAMRFEL